MPDFISVDRRVPFVGRTDELEKLFALFEYGGALTLVGPGGVGKSRLAYEALEQFARDRAREVIFVPLSGVGPEAVFGTVIAAIGAREEVGRDPLDVIHGALQARNVILALDNCEHVPDEAAALIESMQRIHRMAIVATSQRRLDYPDERVLPIAPFDATIGTRFFSERAKSADIEIASDDLPIATAIVERLDGLAVAIDLAAARLTSLTVSELAAELEHLRPYHFRSSAARDPRHHSLGKMIDWSLAPLDTQVREAFALCSIFASSFCTQDVAALDERTIESAQNSLDVLAERSLLVRIDATHFSMLAPMRAVASRLFASSAQRYNIDERFATRMNTLISQIRDRIVANASGDPILELIERYDDACAALAWALKRGRDRIPIVIDIISAMVSIWADGGRLTEGTKWMERLTQQSEGIPQSAYARLSNAAIRVAHANADYGRVLELGPSAITAYTISGDRLGMARAYNALAVASLHLGRIEEANAYVETSVALYRAIDHRAGIGSALLNQANISLDGYSDPIGARTRYEEALAVLLESGSLVQTGIAYGNLAEAMYFLHDPNEALEKARQAMQYFERSQSTALSAWIHELTGRCQLIKGDLKLAKESFRCALAMLERAHQPIYLAQTIESIVRLLLLEREFERAAPLSFASRRLRRERRIPTLGPARSEVRADEERLAQALGPDAMREVAALAQALDLERLGHLGLEALTSA